jgi:hypothetical protein
MHCEVFSSIPMDYKQKVFSWLDSSVTPRVSKKLSTRREDLHGASTTNARYLASTFLTLFDLELLVPPVRK